MCMQQIMMALSFWRANHTKLQFNKKAFEDFLILCANICGTPFRVCKKCPMGPRNEFLDEKGLKSFFSNPEAQVFDASTCRTSLTVDSTWDMIGYDDIYDLIRSEIW